MSVFRKIGKAFSFIWSLRWFKRTFLAISILALLFLVLVVGIEATPQSVQAAFCASCHEMQPEYATFKASAHSDFSCAVCHTDYTMTQIVLHGKKKVLNEVVGHFSQSYVLPLMLTKPLPNSVCESCHSPNRNLTPTGDSNLSREKHYEHVEKGITCVTCHPGVAHGTIAERQATIGGDLGSWDLNTGHQNMSWQFRMIGMSKCMECHKAQNAPLECKACHIRIVLPATHSNPTWVKDGVHGQEAYKDINRCNTCHSYSRTANALSLKDPVAEYARTNTLCIDCHKTKPQGHDQDWSSQHGQKAQLEPKYCLVCHQQAGASKNDNLAVTTCNSCHKSKHKISPNHPVPIPEGKPGGTCYTCHRAATCSKCHK